MQIHIYGNKEIRLFPVLNIVGYIFPPHFLNVDRQVDHTKVTVDKTQFVRVLSGTCD